jgi:hypothetical protein
MIVMYWPVEEREAQLMFALIPGSVMRVAEFEARPVGVAELSQAC